MDKDAILTRLHSLTGSLKPAPSARSDELPLLHRSLLEQLAINPDLAVSGNRTRQDFTQPAAPAEPSSDFSRLLDQLTAQAATQAPTVTPLVFRRETAFNSSLLGNSVPSWGSGLAPTRTYGPFLDERGLQIWFDFFFPTRAVQVFQQGSTTPILVLPIRGLLAGRQSFNVEAGSAWIASGLIAKTPALAGYYTGLKIRGGTLDLSQSAAITAGHIVIPALAALNLHLDLDQNAAPAAPANAGLDAAHTKVSMPQTFQLRVPSAGNSITASNASCTVFGCEVDFQIRSTPPAWIASIGQILVSYSAKCNSETPDTFNVNTSESTLCSLSGRAKFDVSCGWLLPAAKIDPAQLGRAAGTGAMCISLAKGLSAVWQGLTGPGTSLVHPAIIVEPGLVTTVDFFASNVYGKQKWLLWKNAGGRHHSDVTLRFGKAFPFIFISSALNSESVFCFCSYTSAFDRPVDANGAPFRLESSVAFAGILQTGKELQALLLDTDTLFDGNTNKPDAFDHFSLALRNAFFDVSRPYSFFLTGKLENESQITKGAVTLHFGVYRYYPTLPDPYVASFTAALFARPGTRTFSARGFNELVSALAGFIKWPNPDVTSRAAENEAGAPDDPANVYFRIVPLDHLTVVSALEAGPPDPQVEFFGTTVPVAEAPRNFQTGVRTFNAPLSAVEIAPEPITTLAPVTQAAPLQSRANSFTAPALLPITSNTITAEQIGSAVASLEANPLLAHIQDKAFQINQTLNVAAPNQAFAVEAAFAATGTSGTFTNFPDRTLFGRSLFLLLDVSSNADQMGVSFGTSIHVDRDPNGETSFRTVGTRAPAASIGNSFPLQIDNMDVVANAQNLRVVTLPQISWEPLFNIPLAEPYDATDSITTAPGPVVFDNDGIPTIIASTSPFQAPVAPLPATRHFLKEFNDKNVPRSLYAAFTLPFGMEAEASFSRSTKGHPEDWSQLHFNQPYFPQLHGGFQIKAQAPASSSTKMRPFFPGATIQLDDNLKWGFFGVPLTGGALGKTVGGIFNREFAPYGNKPRVPVEQMEISGYGASIFSHWLDQDAAIAQVSQASFDVLVGRTAHEVVQVRSILFPFGVHVVRTITFTRSSNGYVFRSDSGWKAESDGFYDFSYKIGFDSFPEVDVPKPYVVHKQPVKGVSNVREIKDNPDAGSFTSSFKLNDPGLPPQVTGLDLAHLKEIFKQVNSNSDTLGVEMQAVLFDADVHFDNVVSGGVKDPVYGDFKVQSRKMLGYVQVAPSSILIPARVFADLLNFQSGSLGGPVDCIVDIAQSGQRMRITRADVNPAVDGAGVPNFASAARGSLILPKDGSWSVTKQQTNTGDVKPVEEGQSVPLIKPDGAANYKIANPADIVVPNASGVNFGVLQSTGTQKLLFNLPQFSPGDAKLKSEETYFADAYKLLNSKSVFPNIANALQLTNAEKEVNIVGEGLMKMADRTLDLGTLLPSSYEYAFIDEPNILKVYAQYKSTGGANGELKLGIDSTAALADQWKAALSSIRVIVDLGPFKELMWVDGNFNASSGVDSQYDKPNLQFGPVLQPVVDILQILATLTGNDFDKGMDVGMSNSPDNWEYKFSCSKEIPVIQFPSPEELTLDPTPPLKLEAGLKVGFYFNEVLSIPTDLKQLVPAAGAFVDFQGGLHVMCFSLQVASIYAVGQVDLGIAADTKAGIALHMKFGFGVEIVVGLPVVANVSVLYMVEVTVGISTTDLDVGAMMLFRGSAEILGGLIGICIQIEAGGSIHRTFGADAHTDCIAQVTFSIDVTLLWVIDIHESDSWQESRQIA
jgi:hypothetical protein